MSPRNAREVDLLIIAAIVYVAILIGWILTAVFIR